MKPLLIFQLQQNMAEEKSRILADIIQAGIDDGCLIIDNSITVLSFDKDGNLDYVTPREDHLEIL